MANWFVNDGPRYLVLLIWLAANGAMFGVTYYKYTMGKEFYYLREIIGSSLPWARASASCLNFNCMLILLPVCRNLLSYIRGCSTYIPDRSRRDDVSSGLVPKPTEPLAKIKNRQSDEGLC